MKSIFESFMMWWTFCYMSHLYVESQIGEFVTRNAFKVPDINIIADYGEETVTVSGPEATSIDAWPSRIVDFFEKRPVKINAI